LIAACQTLAPDLTKTRSFGRRIACLLPIANGEEYARYRDDAMGALDVALVTAIARTPFSHRTTPKALRAAFAAEFKRQGAQIQDALSGTARH
jgi:hypothetical protein